MELFLNYLKDYKLLIALWIIFGLLNVVIAFLYQNPLEQSFLWISICGFISVVVGCFHFYKYFQTHNELKKSLKEIPFEINQLPAVRNSLESEYQLLIRQLNDERLQLENKSSRTEQEMLDYFTMWVHQIKVPISALYLIIQDEEADLSDEMGEQVFKIEQYVNVILQYMRLENTETDYQFDKVQMDSVIREILKKYAPVFIRKNLPVQFDNTNHLVLTDEKWISFVLEQVLSNALKYTDKGKISIIFEDNILIIEDTGIGIRSEDIPRIAERNFTGFTGRSHKSASGIGLYLSKKILKELGHKLEIESSVGEGTRVKILFDPHTVTTE